MADRQANKSGVSRINRSLLHSVEAVALQKLVRSLPASTTPDTLTAVGLLGAVMTGIGYWLCTWDHAFLWLASAGLVVNWFGDSLDGTLARYRQIERPVYGFFVDHTTDIAAQLSVGIGLGLSPFMRLEVALGAIVTYLSISCVAFIRRAASGVLQISFYGNGPTEMRLLLITINMLLFFLPLARFRTPFGMLSLVDLLVMGLCASSLALLVWMVLRERRTLARRDPPAYGGAPVSKTTLPSGPLPDRE
jgi:phosphatidylglycerophosphate synthase